jgi:hypothetical protein
MIMMDITFKRTRLFKEETPTHKHKYLKYFEVAEVYGGLYLKWNKKLTVFTNVSDCDFYSIKINPKGSRFIRFDENLKKQLKPKEATFNQEESKPFEWSWNHYEQ